MLIMTLIFGKMQMSFYNTFVPNEQLCKLNPENDRPCYRCNYLTKKKHKTLSFIAYDGEEVYSDLNLFYCRAKKTFLFPPQSLIKDNVCDTEDEPNIEMPVSCSSYDDSFDVLELF